MMMAGEQNFEATTHWGKANSLIVVIAVILSCGGCGTQDSAKSSHFEHDHEVAEHWPSDLADAAEKLRSRLAAAEEQPAEAMKLAGEVADIVSWVPEIAADTDLSEQDWIPLDNAAASLTANLRVTGNELTESNRRQTVTLCELIEQSLAKIPDQPPL